MPDLPPLPVEPISRDDWIVLALRTIVAIQEELLMSMSDLNASQDRSEASTTAALAGISLEIQQVRDAVAALSTAATPEEITAFKARLDANTDRLDAAVTALSADDPAAPTA